MLEADGWLLDALRRLDADPLAGAIDGNDRVAIASAAWDAGARLARKAQTRGRRSPEDSAYGGWRDGRRGADACGRGSVSAEAALAVCGVAVDEDDGDPCIGPLVHHAAYSAPPPRVRVYRRAIDSLEPLVDAAGARAIFGAVTVREIVLAHELCHHLIHDGEAPAALRPRAVTFALGPWRRRVLVHAAEEIGAAGFAAAWSGVACGPAVVDALTRFAWSDSDPAPRRETCHGR